MKKYLGHFMGIVFSVAIIVFIIVLLSTYGGAIMGLFGFEYRTFTSMVLFFIFSGILGLPMEIVAKTLPSALVSAEHVSMGVARAIYLILDTSVGIVSMAIVDYFMDDITAPAVSLLVISFISAIICIGDVKKIDLNDLDDLDD